MRLSTQRLLLTLARRLVMSVSFEDGLRSFAGRRSGPTLLKLQVLQHERHNSMTWLVGAGRLLCWESRDGTIRHTVADGGSGSRGGAVVRGSMGGIRSLQAVNKPGSSSFLLKEAVFRSHRRCENRFVGSAYLPA
jgi:hypothetical protein